MNDPGGRPAAPPDPHVARETTARQAHEATVLAPAKVNLGLRIRGRRADGYHLIESLFVPLDLADRVEVGLGPAAPPALRVFGERARGVPGDGSNLAVRAAVGFLEAAGRTDLGVSLALEKRIPAEAGLGGGSSDAGAVLRALRDLLPGAVADAPLRALALSLGADVPYFLDPRPAWVRGIGEEIEPEAEAPELWLVLCHPGVGLSTAAVYAAYDALAGALTPPDPGPTVRPPPGADEPRALAALLGNDLEPAARRLCPPISRLRDRIAEAGALAVGMSGSGPTLFGVFRDEASAREAEAVLAGEASPPAAGSRGAGIWTRVARTLHARNSETKNREPRTFRWGVA